MRRTQQLLFALCALLISSCASTVDVTTDYDRSTNFSQYRTFSYFQDRPEQPRDAAVNFDSSLDLYLRNAIRQSLENQGLRYNSSNPDLKVAYDVAVSVDTEVNTNYTYAPGFGYSYGYWYGYRYNYGFGRFPTPYRTINQYREGTVVVDLIDPDTNELVWRGIGEAAVDMRGKIEQERINTIVTNILQKYPPNSSK